MNKYYILKTRKIWLGKIIVLTNKINCFYSVNVVLLIVYGLLGKLYNTVQWLHKGNWLDKNMVLWKARKYNHFLNVCGYSANLKQNHTYKMHNRGIRKFNTRPATTRHVHCVHNDEPWRPARSCENQRDRQQKSSEKLVTALGGRKHL